MSWRRSTANCGPRAKARPKILVHLQCALGKKPSPTLEEEEFIVSMQGTWKEARKSWLEKAIVAVSLAEPS